MRKLLLTILALLALGGSGAWAISPHFTIDTSSPLTDVSQISADEWYVLYNQGRSKYVNLNASDNSVQLSPLPSTEEDLLPFMVRFEENTAAKTDGGAYQIKFYNGSYLDWTSPVKSRSNMGSLGYVPTYESGHFYFTTWGNNSAKTSRQYINGDANYVVFYGNITDGNNSNYSIYKVTPGIVETVSVGTSTGTYYDGQGNVASAWGGTWKSSVVTSDSSPLLTVTAGTVMNASTGDLYTLDAGADCTYTLTAADGYVITGYTINGTATDADVVITPRLFPSTTVTSGNSLGSAVSVSNIDIQTAYFTLSNGSSTSAHLTDVSLNVTLALSSSISSTPLVEDGTLAYIGYKHIDTSAGRYMQFLSSTGSAARSANQVFYTLDDVPSSAAIYKVEYDASTRTYYLKEPLTGKYLKAKNITLSNTSQSSRSNVLEVGDLPASGDRSLYQWMLSAAGDYVSQATYTIRPKLNPNTSIAVYSTDDTFFVFWDSSYKFAHAFLISETWNDVKGKYFDSSKQANYEKAGQLCYPSTSTTSYANLQALLSLDSYAENDIANLQTYYNAYLQETNIVMPTDGKVYTFTNVHPGGNRYYINSSNGTMSVVATTETPTHYICHKVADNQFAFISIDAWYWMIAANKNSTGTTVSQTYDAFAPLTISQFFSNRNGNCNSATSENTFGLIEVLGKRKGGTGNSVMIVSTARAFDVSGGAYFNASFSSAYQLTEVPDYYNAVTMHVASDGNAYATVYLPFAATVPADVRAFYASGEETSSLTMTEITGTIPANTAVVLVSENAAASGKLYLSPAESAGTAVNGNKLTGTVAAGQTPEEGKTMCVFGDSNGPGFYKSKATTIPLGKAVYMAPQGSAVKSLNFGTTTVGISEVAPQTAADAPLYDLSGRRVASPVRGIYVRGGRKVVVK